MLLAFPQQAHFSYILSGILLWNNRLVDAYSVRSEETLLKLPQWARIRCQVVGDLFSDAVGSSPVPLSQSTPNSLEAQIVPVIGLLPGSKVSFYYPAFVLILWAVHNVEVPVFHELSATNVDTEIPINSSLS